MAATCMSCDDTGRVVDPSACGDPDHCCDWMRCPDCDQCPYCDDRTCDECVESDTSANARPGTDDERGNWPE